MTALRLPPALIWDLLSQKKWDKGVPISFLDKYCPEQFEIVKFRTGDDDRDLCVNGSYPYFRILIRHRSGK
ncbi:MAG: hypothetical protein IJP66_01060 [Kiritimatiellae bacterium]|nr:hypothetical protein [Kiritimatiellia bacterium]